MGYRVRKGKLFFEPRTGNGPCSRRHAGEDYRRHLRMEDTPEGVTMHATKGRLFDGRDRARTAGPPALLLPGALPEATRGPNTGRLRRNDASRWAAVRVDAPEMMTRQRRRRLARTTTSTENRA